MKLQTAFRYILIYGLLAGGAGYFYMLHTRRKENSGLSYLLRAQGQMTKHVIPTTCENITQLMQTNKLRTNTIVQPVVNPHIFQFIIPSQGACFNRNNSKGELFLVLLVKCAPFEKLDREQIRKTWGGVEEVLGRRVLTMFLLGESTDPIIRKEIQEEDSRFHDLIQEDFIDNYQNLTYKNMMGLKWVSMYCPQTSFVFSVDADMMINIVTLVKRLSTMPKTDFAEGHLRTNVIVERNKRSKWYVPKEVYANPRYPPFLNGACYALSRDVAVRVFDTSKYVPFLHVDDAFVGITLIKAGITARCSPMYEQFLRNHTHALETGIGIGILHNRRYLNKNMLKIWHRIVGSQI